MSYIGNQVPTGSYRKLSDISASFNGVTTTFQLSVPPGTAQYYVTPTSAFQLLISVGGVIQEPGVDFTLNGSQIVFSTAPAAGLSFFGIQMGDALNVGTPSDGTITTAKLVDNSVTTAKLNSTGIAPIVTSLNGGQIAGNRNRLINGSMMLDQRNAGASQTFTAGAALAYSVDRWYGYCTGANVTGQRVQGASAGLFRYRFTGAASVTAIGFGQRIEQLNCAALAGTTATLSVDLANSLLSTVTWTAFYANTANTFGTLASPTRTQIATGTFTVNSTVTRYSTQISIPSAATTGIEIVFTVGAQTSGTWTIGDVQLEPGSVATPFERRSYGVELALCQRYYWIGRADTAGARYASGSGTWNIRDLSFPVTMRATPAVTILTAGYTNCTAASASSISVDGFSVTVTTTGAVTFTYLASADAVIEL